MVLTWEHQENLIARFESLRINDPLMHAQGENFISHFGGLHVN